MPFLSSPLLLRTHSLTLLLSSYYLVTSPSKLLSSTPIWLLGESMSIRPASYTPETPDSAAAAAASTSMHLKGLISGQRSGSMGSEREILALLAVLLVVYAGMMFLFAGDLTLLPTAKSEGGRAEHGPEAKSSSRYAEEIHTLLTAQSRWLTLSGLHVLGSSIVVAWIYLFHAHSSTDQSLSSSSLSGLDLMANRVTFTAALVDMLFWGYLWTVLKDEGREVGKALAMRRAADDERDE